ncbi:MAG: 50S ribosomal protein L6 [Clostridia bacterium]|nr:50S ribosomal protein L6 [Clostridia bacterium]
MSRIGRLHIAIPAGVTVEYKDQVVTVKGPKATLTQTIASKDINVEVQGAEVCVTRANDNKESKAMHGLYRMLIANMVKGVVTPFTKTLVIAGVGYKATVAGNKLTMNLGLSHNVEYVAPEGITITCPDANTVVISGASKEVVGQVAATIKSKRPVEPYHGYGIHYSDEVVIRKEGKTAGK